MNSPQVKKMVATLVDWYATRDTGLLVLDPKDIPESDLNNLAGLILSQDDMRASEANGPDNDDWDKSMLPALIRTMQHQKNGYNMEEFHDIWTAGVRNYLMPVIKKMIAERLECLNEDMECHMSLIWDRASEKVIEIESRTLQTRLG